MNNPEKAPYCEIKHSWRKLQQLDQRLKEQYDVCLNQAILLCCLSQRCKNQGNIAGETGLTATQTSRVISKLESKGLIERTIGEDDKRKMVFALTTKGQDKLKEITPEGVRFLTM